MRRLLVLASIATLIATIASVNAQGLFGFRLLKLDGEHVIWTTWKGEPKATHVTYAFVRARTDTPDAINCRSIGPIDSVLKTSNLERAAFRNEVRAAFDMWESVANIQFTEVDDPSRAGILIGGQLEPFGRAFANVAYKPGEADPRAIARSMICFNPAERWKIGFDGNLDVYDIRYTAAHEIGHAIGLDHPVSAGQLMHYSYEERFRALQPGDIEGAVLLYGLREQPADVRPEPRVYSASVSKAAVRD